MDVDVGDGIAKPRNRIVETMRRGQVALCLRVTLAATNDLAFVAAAAGFDALYVDLEHSTASASDAAQVCSTAEALGLTPLARLTSVDDPAAVPLLDAGCQGVIAPYVRSAAEARRLVDRCLMAPLGRRTPAGPSRLLGHRSVGPARLAALVNATTLLCVMVEDPEGVGAVEEIAGVPGVGLVLVGTQDLAYPLEVPGDVDHPRVQAAYSQVSRGCAAAGTPFGIAGVAGDAAISSYVALGARFVSAGTDVDLLRAAATSRVDRLRSLCARPGPHGEGIASRSRPRSVEFPLMGSSQVAAAPLVNRPALSSPGESATVGGTAARPVSTLAAQPVPTIYAARASLRLLIRLRRCRRLQR